MEQGLKQIDIVPLINIIFLLLVFLILSSIFLTQPGIKINLPKTLTSEVVRDGNIEILVNADGEAYFNQRPIDSDELKKLFKQVSNRSQTILIKADKRASLGRIVKIWDLARATGISQVNIATNQE